MIEHNSGRKDIELKEARIPKTHGSAKRNLKQQSILRIPYTGGTLKSKIETTLKNAKRPKGTLAIAQEDNGQKLKHQLVKPDPFPKKNCGRERCKAVVKGESVSVSMWKEAYVETKR